MLLDWQTADTLSASLKLLEIKNLLEMAMGTVGGASTHWATDEQLCEAWNAAIAWADEHPNFMKDLRAGKSNHNA